MGVDLSLRLPERFAIAALLIGLAASISGVIWGPRGYAIAGAFLAFALAWASCIDLSRFILPNVITLGLAAVGLGLAAIDGIPTLGSHAIGVVVGYGAMAGLAAAYRRLRGREGLGLGDAKLLAAAGAWLGWAGLPTVLLIGSGIGLVVAICDALMMRRFLASRPIAFGPTIAAGFWIVWLTGPIGGYPYPTFAC